MTGQPTVEKEKNAMEEVEDGDFFTISRKLAFLLHSRFGVDHIFLWVIRNNSPRLILTMGLEESQNFGPNDLIKEKTFNDFLNQQVPYLSNHAIGDEPGLFKDASKAAQLPAEIGLPFYEVTDREYLKNEKRYRRIQIFSPTWCLRGISCLPTRNLHFLRNC